MPQITAEYPSPTLRLAHLSDVHLPGPAGSLLYGAADADGHLAAQLTTLVESGTHVDALVFSGDLADHGDESAYRRLRAAVEPVAERLGASVIFAMGNHDDRAHFRTALLDAEPSAAPVDYVTWVGDLRVIILDTTVPGRHFGAVTPEQRGWLAEVLESAAPSGSLLVMHHPPLPAVLDLAQTVELRDQELLEPVISGSDVRSILAGHVHYSSFGTFASVPVSVASSTAYTQDLSYQAGGTRGRDGAQAYNLIDVYPSTVVHSVVPIGRYPTVGEEVPAATVRRRLVEAGVVRPTCG